MSDLLIVPTETDYERHRKFSAHKNYVVSIRDFLVREYGSGQSVQSGVIHAQADMLAGTGIKRSDSIDEDALRRYLTISWASSLQVNLANYGKNDVVRYFNVWVPVQSYYAIHMACQAYLASSFPTGVKDNHSWCLRTMSSEIVAREILPLPWSASCSGCIDYGECIVTGFPDGEDYNRNVNVLSAPSASSFWPRLRTMLKTTREKQLKERYEREKQRSKKSRLSRDEKIRISSRVHDTTILDYFWRLRARMNYEDVESFISWNISDQDHADLWSAMVFVTDSTCSLLDSLTIRRCDPEIYMRISDDFLRSASGVSGALEFLRRRRETLLDSLPFE